MAKDDYKEWLKRNAGAFGGPERVPKGNTSGIPISTRSTGSNKGRGSVFTPPKAPTTVKPSIQQTADEYLRRLTVENEKKIGGSPELTDYYSQKGQIPDPSSYEHAPTSPSNPYMPVGQGSGGGMGASAGMAQESVGPTMVDLDALYAELTKKLADRNRNVVAGFDESQKGISDTYARSELDMYSDYMNSRKDLEASVAGLGGGASSLAQYDTTLRGIQESSDLAEVGDQSYLSKMRAARGIELEDIMTQLERDKMAQKVSQNEQMLAYMAAMESAKSGGGSGGGGRGRGSGGSGDSTLTGSETATETQVLEDPTAALILQSIQDPELRAQMLAYMDAQLGNPVTQAIAGDIDNLVKQYPVASKKMTTAGGYANRFKNQQVGLAQNWLKTKVDPLKVLLDSSRGMGSAATGTPTTSQKVVTTAKKAAPKKYVT